MTITTDFSFRDVAVEARAYLIIAGISFVFGLAFLMVELLSPDLVIWNGRCVPASFDGVVAEYTVGGRQYSVDNPPLQDRTPRAVTVCYYPSDPSNGYIVHPAAYWLEGALVVIPISLALVIAFAGIWSSFLRLRNAVPLPPLGTFRDRLD